MAAPAALTVAMTAADTDATENYCAHCVHWQYLPYSYGRVRCQSVIGYCEHAGNGHYKHVLTCAHKACGDFVFMEDEDGD